MNFAPGAPAQPPRRMRTTIHFDNLHCQSCVDSVTGIFSYFSSTVVRDDLEQAKSTISDFAVSLPDRTVSFSHPNNFNLDAVLKQLAAAGFDVSLDSKTPRTLPAAALCPSSWRSFLTLFRRPTSKSTQREAMHRQICSACRPPHDPYDHDGKVSHTEDKQALYESQFALEGLTCSSCTSAISAILSPSSEPGVKSCQVTLLPPAALVIHDAHILPADSIRELVSDAGYGAELVTSKRLSSPALESVRVDEPTSYKAVYSVLGMTCSSCVSSVARAMESVPGTTAVSVDLIGNTASVVLPRKEDAELVRSEVEEVGFECAVVDVFEQRDRADAKQSSERTITAKIDGMHCEESVENVNKTLEALSYSHALTFTPLSLDTPTSTITYIPKPPAFTLRLIRDSISALGFTFSIVHVDSIEERAARARVREQRTILLYLAVTFLFAVPTFIVGVVGMSLARPGSRLRTSLDAPVWGNATCGTVILFALATPVQFGVGGFFYRRAWKSLKGVWRKRKAGADRRRVWLERLFRWGSMDTLVALGITTSYCASVALMILDIRTTPHMGMMGGAMGWFDSSVFFMLFTIGGRYLESISKQRTGDAISALSATKPSTGLLYSPTGSSTTPEPVDFIEVGDVLIVPVGSSPPLDAVLTDSSPRTTFDESSLTGEARPVLKAPTDAVFAGTTNAGPAAAVVTVTNEVGKTMLDGIVGVVRDAMGRKAGLERIADIVTGYFVPFIVGVAALTFGVWCLRGYLGGLPPEWVIDQRKGGWALFAAQFGVAVLVAACPCGIGLAAPSAQMVGVGLAAQHGVLSNGGGEAFQAISSMNTVVLDKTGTLTTSKFTVSDDKIMGHKSLRTLVCSMLKSAEQASTHPLAVGVREWCQTQLTPTEKPSAAVDLISSEEIPGRGLVAALIVDGNKVEVAIGNERLMDDMGAQYESESASIQAQNDLLAWKQGGKSVILLSAKLVMESSSSTLLQSITSEHHSVLGLFGIHDPPRPEASTLVAELQRLHIDVWMISGDNTITAKTVARTVGIHDSNVIAGALPIDKRTWVKRLQNGEGGSKVAPRQSWWGSRSSGRTIVAFCGDGINDAPAIAQADVGLAMGGGSNVAVSTADFCLLSSNLLSLLTMHHLARATRRKIITNFIWACLYNVVLMPLAAGAFYPLGRTSLPPVWGAAAMALSSVSVVVNSLVLRLTYSPPRAVRTWSPSVEV